MNTLGIIVAMFEEAENLIASLQDKNKITISKRDFYTGTLFHRDVIIAVSEVGKVNAASATQILIDRFNVNAILNIGIAGALDKDIKPLDVLAVDNVIQYDFDLSLVNNSKVGQLENISDIKINLDKNFVKRMSVLGLKCVTCCSGDRITNHQSDIDLLNSLSCQIRDMELAAIAQVCHLNDVKLFAIKAISNGINHSLCNGYYTTKKLAVKAYFDIISEIFNNIY